MRRTETAYSRRACSRFPLSICLGGLPLKPYPILATLDLSWRSLSAKQAAKPQLAAQQHNLDSFDTTGGRSPAKQRRSGSPPVPATPRKRNEKYELAAAFQTSLPPLSDS